MSAPDPETLRRVLLDHHPVVRSETGPLAGCRCGQVKPGQDVIAHVAAQVAAAYRAAQDGGAEEAVRRVEALAYESGSELSDVDPDGLDDAARAQHLANISLHTKLCLALWGSR